MMAVFKEKEINERLKKLSYWSYENNQIGKEFKFKDFKSALEFVNKVGEEAEKMNHHPDIFLHSWNKVKLTVSTHSEGGVTEKDFTLAGKVESLSK